MVLVGSIGIASATAVIGSSIVAATAGGFGGALTLLALPVLVPPLAIAVLVVVIGRRVRRGRDRTWGVVAGACAAGATIPFALNSQWFHDSMHFSARFCAAGACSGRLQVGADRPPALGAWTMAVGAFVVLALIAALVSAAATATSGHRIRAVVTALIGAGFVAGAAWWGSANASTARAAAERACSKALAAERGLYTFEDSVAKRAVPHQSECDDPVSVARQRDPRFGAR